MSGRTRRVGSIRRHDGQNNRPYAPVGLAIASLLLSSWTGIASTARSGAPSPGCTGSGSPAHAEPAADDPEAIRGQWAAEIGATNRPVSLSLWRSGPESFFQARFDVPLEALKGLSRDDAMRRDSSARFEIVRDAGVFRCEGRFDRGKGQGRWMYVADSAFAVDMARRGWDNLAEEDLFKLAVNDVSRAFCAEMQASGYDDLSFENLLALRVHDIDRAYVESLAAAGYARLPIEDLLAMRIHEVTADFIAKLRSLGYDRVAPEDLVALRVHKVTIRFIEQARARGDKPTIEDLIELHIHGKRH